MFSKCDVEKLKILVVGDLMSDCYINGSVDRISPEAPIPVVNVKSVYEKLGGAGNVIENLLSLGVNVSALSCVGNDDAGKKIKNSLDSLGVNTDGIILSDNRLTTVKTRIVSRNQQLLRYDFEKTDKLCTDDERRMLDRINPGCFDAVIISDYNKGVVTETLSQNIIKKCISSDIPVSVDPKGNDYTKYGSATFCTPNMKEFCDVTGQNIITENDILKYGIELIEKTNMKYLLLTRSEKGLTLIDREGNKRDFPAVAKEVIDVTGAGDTVISVFTVCYALNIDLSECCRLSNFAASDVISKFGTASTDVERINEISSQYR